MSRLADGGLRDALSLLDQCAGPAGPIGEQQVLDALGLAGNLETARLMGRVADRDAGGALENIARLYGGGKDISAILGELASLTRDLLIRKTAPRSGGTLLNGGFDETTMRGLSEKFTAPRLVWMLTVLQAALAELPRSSNRRTDAELCLIRLCDERLDDSAGGLAARLDRVEAQLSSGVPLPKEKSENTCQIISGRKRKSPYRKAVCKEKRLSMMPAPRRICPRGKQLAYRVWSRWPPRPIRNLRPTRCRPYRLFRVEISGLRWRPDLRIK